MPSPFLQKIDALEKAGHLSDHYAVALRQFYHQYRNAIKATQDGEAIAERITGTFLELILEQIQHPYPFEIFHDASKMPPLYHHFGIDFMIPLIDRERSTVRGQDNLREIQERMQHGENVILLANHQIEPDPYVIQLMIEKDYPELASNMIFIAGHRVTTDPFAIPMSLGCNLLCIYSKKHMENPPEDKPEKVSHNRRTMGKLKELLEEGGKCIYVAPSGGRDRKDDSGKVVVAPFDPSSCEIFSLYAKNCTNPTHLYPLALSTYFLIPPPQELGTTIGEERIFRRGPVHLHFADRVDFNAIPIDENSDKDEQRHQRAHYIWNIVNQSYQQFPLQ